MIDIRELRVGNWINEQGLELKVGMINSELFKGSEGIPLTEDWLVKLGAIKSTLKKHIEYRIGKRLFIKRGDCFHDYGTDTSLHYVHQLQNLYFAITGTELEIKTE